MSEQPKRRLNLDEAEEIARAATREALASDPRWDAFRREIDEANLTLGSLIGRDSYAFQLYIAGDRPVDGKVFTRAVVGRSTGEVAVALYLDGETPPDWDFA